MDDLIIRSIRVVQPGTVGPAAIHISDGRISAIGAYGQTPAGVELIDAGESVVMPGLVDAHVHVNEPGRTEWEGYATATMAAAAGGVTTIVDMPLNSIPPTTTVAGLETKLNAARGQCLVDVAFWGGVIPGNAADLEPLIKAGVRGFKCFLIHSGVEEFPHVEERDLRIAMIELARLDVVLLVHAELPEPIDEASAAISDKDSQLFSTFLSSRPREAENQAIALMIRLSREIGTRVHIVHHSSSDALPMLQSAKADGVKITAETCPHYLTFAAEEIPRGATEFKCCPPVRERENREKLWAALNTGVLDMVVSDHSPCTPALKRLEAGDFVQAWGGIASLQLGLPVMWTNMRKRGLGLAQLSQWMSLRPATLAGLDQRKGQLRAGLDADLVIWNPEREFEVRPEMIHHRHKLTPYNARLLKGVVEQVYRRGRRIYDNGTFADERNGEMIVG